MLTLPPWRRTLAEVLAGPDVSAEIALTAERLAKPVLWFQQNPDLAIPLQTGVVSVPHQRLIIWAAHSGMPENIFVCGRGTAKSSTLCVQYVGYRGANFRGRKIIELSAVGFRGGQSIFLDLERWASGQWDDQTQGRDFIQQSIKKNPQTRSLIHRAQNYWQIDFKSGSYARTLPTNNEENLRGERGHLLFNDEANTMSEALTDEVSKSFLNVGLGFASGGATGESNQVFYLSTIDYQWRPFMRKVEAAKASLHRTYQAHQAMRAGDWALYADLEKRGILEYSYTCIDYSDTIVRRLLTNRDGKRFEVTYPCAQRLIGLPQLHFRAFPRGIPFTTLASDGRIEREGTPMEALTTYAIDIGNVERDLINGAVDEAIWLREQKNVVDNAAGDVYAHGLMDAVTCRGERSVIPYADCSEQWQFLYKDDQRDYAPGVMWECTDPCVLGVDVAGGNRDFAAFVVFRIGPSAEGRFDPATGLGRTDWSNVVWVEQHRMMTQRQVADKIRELKSRYHLVWHHEPWKDDWEWCRAIGLDTRNVGSGVRDALVGLDQSDDDMRGAPRIYDPLDPDERIQAFAKDLRNWPILDAITAQDTTNDKLVEFTLSQMKVGRLYLPKWLEESQRPDRDAKLDIGYNGARVLDYQLRRLQQEPTARARKFYMPGDSELQTEKKDAWAGFIYGAKQLRAHLIRQSTVDKRPPAMGGMKVTVNSKGGRWSRPMGGRDGGR